VLAIEMRVPTLGAMQILRSLPKSQIATTLRDEQEGAPRVNETLFAR